VHLASFHLVGIPGDRRASLEALTVLDHVGLPRAELDLDQLIAGPLELIQRFVAHQIGQDATRFLACLRLDVDPLEVVAVARVALDHALGRAAGQADGGLDVRQVGQLDDVGDTPVPVERGLVEVEQRDLVAVDAGLFVYLPLHRARRGHGRQPLGDVGLVHLDPQHPGRLDDLINVLLGVYLASFVCHRLPPYGGLPALARVHVSGLVKGDPPVHQPDGNSTFRALRNAAPGRRSALRSTWGLNRLMKNK